MAKTNISDEDNVREYLLALNDLGQPKMVDMSVIEINKLNSAVILIARLIMMRKGTDPDRPDMGIDIAGRYRFSFTNELYNLEREIQDQLFSYLPELSPITVSVSYQSETTKNLERQNKICIDLNINMTTYRLMYDRDSSKLKVLE